ncbi:MBL fold metallo-hydrolase [Paenibacillus sp. SI8]|uniref:MBL fold metallo-hydrolase n=1 Tax=unclassified Paenibacillus TaxID=185978 RepID=UPI0034652E33
MALFSTFVVLIVGLILLGILFMRLYPVFGRKPSQMKVDSFHTSEHLESGKFRNRLPMKMDTSLKSTVGTLIDFIKGNPNRRPPRHLPMASPVFNQSNNQTQVTWFGHSASMLTIDGKTLLLDPMFGKTPSPFPLFGKPRYSGGMPLDTDDFPPIDVVVLSHDHYDHLDYGTIQKLKLKVGMFLVPLGVGGHLERWGIERERIQEYDWWEELTYAGLRFACTPAIHFSGRSLTDRNATLWCSWVIKGKQTSIFFSGDSGYGPHFKEIGDKYGPFDLTLMECGQYDERWSDIHMMPEESVEAHLDVKGKVMMPIHWGAFTLALHAWTDPVERALKAAERKNVAVATPRIGETMAVEGEIHVNTAWWRQV